MGMWRWRLMIFIHLTWIYTQEYSPSANYDCWIHGYCYAPLGIYAWGDCCWASHIFTPQPTDENAPEWGQLIFDQYQLCWTSKLTTSKVHSTLSSTTITMVWLMQLRQLAMNIAGKKTKQRISKPSNILFYLSFCVGSKDVSNFVMHSFIIIRLVVNKSVNIVEQNVWCFITVYNCHNQKCNIRPLLSSKILVEQPMNELPLLCVHGFGFIHRYVDKQRKFVNLFYLAGIQMGTIGRKWETE